jgi:hypothetical protein
MMTNEKQISDVVNTITEYFKSKGGYADLIVDRDTEYDLYVDSNPWYSDDLYRDDLAERVYNASKRDIEMMTNGLVDNSFRIFAEPSVVHVVTDDDGATQEEVLGIHVEVNAYIKYHRDGRTID